MTEAIIFDMDGLLIDSEPLWKIAEINVFGTVGIDLTSKGCEETVGLRIDQVVDLWFGRHPWDNKTTARVTEEIIEEMAHLIKQNGKPLPGAISAVENAKIKVGKVGLATSSHDVLIEATLEKLGLKDHFDVTHSAQHEDYGKPHPQVFLTTAQKLKVKPENCHVFEDSLNGVIAAKAARMKVTAVPEKTHNFDPRLHLADDILNSLEEINWNDWNKLPK